MSYTYLPATQPVTDSLEENSPVDYENPWGRFYPLRIELKQGYINLIQDSFTIGRCPLCDYTLTKEEVGDKLYDCISNFQCKVERKEESNGTFVTLVTDLSSNGTYLNGTLIGKNNTSVLSHNDSVAIAKATCPAFLFIDLTEQHDEYPEEVTKNYAILHTLGKGGYGEVRFVRKRQTAEIFAMKKIDMKPIEDKRVIDVFNEVKILRQLCHVSVVSLHNTILVENDMYLFLEYMPGGDLACLLREKTKLPEDVTKFIFWQILQGVAYLHSRKILHRDLKPANILLNAKTNFPLVKITDFGLSKIMDNNVQAVHTRCGTLSFAAPELQFSNVCNTYDYRADIWSLGVILYLCLSGILPFRRDRKDFTLEQQINRANFSYHPETWRPISMRARMIINKCLMRLPAKRWSKIEDIIDDEWFKKDPVLERRLYKLSNNDKENTSEPPVKKRRC